MTLLQRSLNNSCKDAEFHFVSQNRIQNFFKTTNLVAALRF